ncbi:MAG: DnaJ C-terminal domain-containing protein [Pseudonocardiaceae bacterium]
MDRTSYARHRSWSPGEPGEPTMARDYYEVLGVARDAGADELQQAYRRLARANHPDINNDPAAEERFKEINEAYHVLADPDTRRRYDRFGADFRQVPPDYERATAGAGPVGGGFGGGAGRRVRVEGFGDDVDLGGVDFEDLLGGIFGSRARAGPLAGADQEAEMELSVEDAYRGGRRQITLAGLSGQRSYDVTVPAGVIDGQRIRLAGQGGQGTAGGPPGDLYLVVRIAPHERYSLDGRDVSVELPITPWEAALGATVAVATLGSEVKVRVPPGSSSGRRLRLRGEGMPNPRGTPGDLYAVIQVMVPPRLGERERELFEELARISMFEPRSRS